MNKQHKKFCEEYVTNGLNGTHAYFAAYTNIKKETTARTNASRLLTNANVCAYIQELQAKLQAQAILNIAERQKILSSIVLASEEETSYNDKMKAIDILNKMDGAYTTNTNVTMEGGVNITIVPDADD